MAVRETSLTRRSLLWGGLTVVAVAGLPRGPLRASPCAGAGPHAAVAPPEEPGERLHVEGLVFAPDGTTPVAGVLVYVYQTDASGRYNRTSGFVPRLRAFLRTGRDGEFSFDTIRPGAYPTGTTPAHIHFQLWGAGYPPQYGPTIFFDGDPLIPREERQRSLALGAFGNVQPVTKHPAYGPLVKVQVRLKSAGDAFEESTRHGLEACGLRREGPRLW